ncbi:hypothetical protein Mapa_008466 [Marchantia paleacea]|nr:hypothetical protein Mapa_008466 [Marchantia paleacea]
MSEEHRKLSQVSLAQDALSRFYLQSNLSWLSKRENWKSFCFSSEQMISKLTDERVQKIQRSSLGVKL